MLRLIFVLSFGCLLAAQPRYRQHYFTAGGGTGIPRGDLHSLFDASPAFRFGYGYRMHPNFQVDAGLDTVIHAANVRDLYPSFVGDLRIRDYEFLVPLGGRAIVPLGDDRVLLSAGGGGAYVRYQESIRQPFGDAYVRLECTSCRSRSGFGYYALLGASVALDRYQHFRLGVTTRVYRATTRGDLFGALPSGKTRDTWIATAAEFTFSF